MEKKNSESQQFFTRTGKYSDRYSRRGYMPGVNSEIGGPPLKEQISNIQVEIEKTLVALNDVKVRLKQTMPYPEFIKLDSDRKTLGSRHQDLLELLGDLNRRVRDAKTADFNKVFTDVAKARLTVETFQMLLDEAHEIINAK